MNFIIIRCRRKLPVYCPSAIKAPAMIARMAMSVPSPEKLRLRSGIRPVKMSQTPNKSMPRFLGSFISRLLSAIENVVAIPRPITRIYSGTTGTHVDRHIARGLEVILNRLYVGCLADVFPIKRILGMERRH